MTTKHHKRRLASVLRCATALLALLSWSWVPAQVPSAASALAGPRRVEQSDPSVVYTGVWYTAISLVPGPHTITIKVTGTWNPAGCCSWVAIDAFDVL